MGQWYRKKCVCVSVHTHNSENADQIGLKCLRSKDVCVAWSFSEVEKG